MPYSAANVRFQRRVQLDLANKTAGGAIQALGVADPNVGAITPTARTLGFGTDSSLWVANGATWANLSAGGGGTSFADNVFLTFGTTPAYKVGYDTTTFGSPFMVIEPVSAATGAAGSGGAAGAGVATQGTVTTSAGAGKVSGTAFLISGSTTTSGAGSTGGASGTVLVQSGDTDCNSAGGTGGASGEVQIFSGAAASTAGTSGNSGQVRVYSGDSADGNSGNVSLITGAAAAGVVGDVVLAPNVAPTIPGVVYLEAPVATRDGLTPATKAYAVQLAKEFTITNATVQTFGVYRNFNVGNATLHDIILVKTGAVGAAGDTVTIATIAGNWAVIDLNGVAAGTVVRLGSAGVTLDVTKRAAAAMSVVTVTPTEASSVDCILLVSFSN